MSETGRYYWRCLDCLSVVATEDASAASYGRIDCATCGGRMKSMGRVQRSGRLAHELHGTPCDSRCTMAPGPCCDCRCGGENHGSKLVVTIIKDAGTVPQMRPINEDAARRRADEWRRAQSAFRAAFDARFLAVTRAKNMGNWISPADFALYRNGANLEQERRRIERMTGPTRTAKMNELAARTLADVRPVRAAGAVS